MKKSILILGGPLVLLLVLVGAFYFGRRTATLLKAPDHGIRFSIQAEDSSVESKNGVAELKKALVRRFSTSLGLRIFWEPVSEKEFRVYVPVLDSQAAEQATALVSTRGHLELRLVHPDSRSLIAKGELPSGFEVLKQNVSRQQLQLKNAYEPELVNRQAEGGPSGIHIRQAVVTRSSLPGRFEIQFTLTPESTEQFRLITSTNIGRRLAIVIDGELVAAPVIQSEISAGAGVISGDFSAPQAFQLATLLENPLPFGVKLLGTESF